MRTCYIASSRSHAFYAQAAKDVMLAAEDEVTRQRCMRIIEASGMDVSPLQDIASAVALTRDLLGMNCLSAIKAVLTALGIPMSDPSLNSVGLDLPSLKAAGFDVAAFVSCKYDWATIRRAGFSAAEVKAAGCNAASAIGAGYDLPSLKAAGFNAMTLKLAGCSFSALVLARFSAEELTEAGFSSEVQVFPLTFALHDVCRTLPPTSTNLLRLPKRSVSARFEKKNSAGLLRLLPRCGLLRSVAAFLFLLLFFLQLCLQA